MQRIVVAGGLSDHRRIIDARDDQRGQRRRPTTRRLDERIILVTRHFHSYLHSMCACTEPDRRATPAASSRRSSRRSAAPKGNQVRLNRTTAPAKTNKDQ